MKPHLFLATALLVFGCTSVANKERTQTKPNPPNGEGSNSNGTQDPPSANPGSGTGAGAGTGAGGESKPQPTPSDPGAAVPATNPPVACSATTVSGAYQCLATALTTLMTLSVASADDRTSLSKYRSELKTNIDASSSNDTYRILACSKNSLIRFRISNMSFVARRDGILSSEAELNSTFGPSISASDALNKVLGCP